MTMSSGHPHARGHTDVGQGGEEAVTDPPARTGAHRGARRYTKRAPDAGSAHAAAQVD